MALNIDMAPTSLDLAGLPIPTDMDGQSLVSVQRNPRAKGRSEFLMEFWRYFPENTPSYRGVRTKRFKYVEFERGRSPWLFDLATDPAERVNLYNSPEVHKTLGKMRSLLEAFRHTRDISR